MKTSQKIISIKKYKNENLYKIFEAENHPKNLFRSPLKIHKSKKQKHIPNAFSFSSNMEKKMKEITLSLHSYSKYMDDYTKLTQTYTYKSPDVSFYPLTKNEKFLPIGHKKNFSSILKKSKKLIINPCLSTPEVNEILTRKHEVTKKIRNRGNFFNLFNSTKYNNIVFKDDILFEYFIEGYFLREPKILKTLNLENTPLNYQFIQKDINYFNKYLLTLSKNKNYDYTKEKEFIYRLPSNRNEVTFRLIINSIYLSFTDVQAKIKYKKFLPFKYMILFYLLDYSMLKEFFSEIFYFDKTTDEFQVNKDTIDDVIDKYSLFIHNKLNYFGNLDSDNMIFKENELLYNTEYIWILNNDGDYKVYEMKIVFPRIKFQVTNFNLKFVKSMNKYLLINIIKNNFLQWDKYLLYELFMTKKLRKIIDDLFFISGKVLNITSFQNKKFYLSKLKNDTKSTSKNKQTLEFYITQINCQSSQYFNFVPNSISVIYFKKVSNFIELDENKNKYEKIQLTLKESQNLYKLSKYWGLLNTIKKCMNYSNMTQKYSFNFDILDDISDDIISATKINKSLEKNTSNNKLPFKFKLGQIEFTIQDCFLSQMVLIDQNKIQINYILTPQKLLEYILNNFNKNNHNNEKFNNIIGECSSDIIKEKIIINLTEEINCRGEFKKLTGYEKRHKSPEGTSILVSQSNSGTLKITKENNISPNINSISPRKTFQVSSFTKKKLSNENEIKKIPEKIIEELKIQNEEENKDKRKKKLKEFNNNFKSRNKIGFKEKPFWVSLEKMAKISTKFKTPISNKKALTKLRKSRNEDNYRLNSLAEIDKLKNGLITK